MKRTALHLAAIALLLTMFAFAQRFGFRGGRDADEEAPPKNGEFYFLRLEYTDAPEYHRRFGYTSRDGVGSGWWMMDWPAAENHFTAGVTRLTRIDAGNPRHLRLTDDRIFDYPWIYATQTGWWDLTAAETKRLHDYLERGGFLVTDDFWGPEQWEVFRRTMDRVFPGQTAIDIDESHQVMHVLYDIGGQDLTWIPGSRHLRQDGSGRVVPIQPPGTQPAWRALFDSRGRMVVAINFNSDVADAWEFADVPYYPERMTSLAYRYGINYVIYAMTH